MSRSGTFSSSQISKLISFGKVLMNEDELRLRPKSGEGSKTIYKPGGFSDAGLTYIKQVKIERELGRSINKETNARSTSWGNLMEIRVFNMLNTDYVHVSKDRLFHPEFNFWSGAPDFLKVNTVADCKAPFSLETFYDKIQALKSGIEKYKEEFPEDYWQHISNTILLESNGIETNYFEAIIYAPYRSELNEIREMVNNFDGPDQSKYAWINWASDYELPFILDGGKFKNLNIFRFEVPKEDKEFLTKRILQAEEKTKK